MHIATSWSTQSDTVKAVEEAYEKLGQSLNGEPPTLLLTYYSNNHDSRTILKRLDALSGNVPIQGGTSCLGIMTQQGFHSADGCGFGLWAIQDPQGSYSVGIAAINDNPRQAAAEATEMALAGAGRPGEVPALVWLNSAPGCEEKILQGIEDVLGRQVPIAGGSTGDNTVAGDWKQIGAGQVHQNAVVVTVMYPSTEVAFAFHSGYEPAEHRGRVTRATGRTLYEIDGRPAAQVYNEWTGGIIAEALPAGGNVLPMTTLSPLGREVGRMRGVPYFKLSHPNSVAADGALTLFSDIEEGEEILLMTGSKNNLVTRAGRVAESAISAGSLAADDVCGALVIYCAGCMLTIQSDMDKVATGVSGVLKNNPFIGVFTFGEQGCFVGGENRHGNLMISVVVFGRRAVGG
ncbi:MAG: FIST C-terminal domain-containing protein [Gammaproteobacteria bacterium]|nr:FIST C-terminal domain-containing protein [Gammaproteobacteria bacterium]